jgi:hypothetical protein
MAESVRVTNMPESGSRERVAYELWYLLRSELPRAEGEGKIKRSLDLYAECLDATTDRRTVATSN